MTRISIHTELADDVAVRTSFSSVILAAENERQPVDEQHVHFNAEAVVRRVHFGPTPIATAALATA